MNRNFNPSAMAVLTVARLKDNDDSCLVTCTGGRNKPSNILHGSGCEKRHLICSYVRLRLPLYVFRAMKLLGWIGANGSCSMPRCNLSALCTLSRKHEGSSVMDRCRIAYHRSHLEASDLLSSVRYCEARPVQFCRCLSNSTSLN